MRKIKIIKGSPTKTDWVPRVSYVLGTYGKRIGITLLMVSLTACQTLDTQLGQGGGMVSGSAGSAGTKNAAVELPRCSASLGAVALVEENIPGLAQSGLSSPVPLIRLMIAQSNCFQVVDRGQAMQRIEQERRLQSQGLLQSGANLGGGQIVAADYLITPNIIFQDKNAGAVGAGIGAFLPGMLGLIAGGLSLKKLQAETMLTLTNVRTGVQQAIAQGSAQKQDLALFGGGIAMGGLPIAGLGGGYASTDLGKIVTAAFLDSYTKLVTQVRALKSNAATHAPRASAMHLENNAIFTDDPIARAVFTTTATLNVRAKPSRTASVVGKATVNAQVTTLGQQHAGWWRIQTENKKTGWVLARYLKPFL